MWYPASSVNWAGSGKVPKESKREPEPGTGLTRRSSLDEKLFRWAKLYEGRDTKRGILEEITTFRYRYSGGNCTVQTFLGLVLHEKGLRVSFSNYVLSGRNEASIKKT